MASTNKPSVAAAAAVLLVVVIGATLLAPARASTLTAFSGPGCSGHTKDVNYVCGCYDITGYQGGFHFVFTEDQEAYLHRGRHCRDPHPFHLNKETRYCQHVRYQSIQMMC